MAASGHLRCSPMFHRRINRGVRVGEDLTARGGAAEIPCPFSRVSCRMSLRVYERFLTVFPVVRVDFSRFALHFSWPNYAGCCGRFVGVQFRMVLEVVVVLHFDVCRVCFSDLS